MDVVAITSGSFDGEEVWVDPRDTKLKRWQYAALAYDFFVVFALPLINQITDVVTMLVFASSYTNNPCVAGFESATTPALRVHYDAVMIAIAASVVAAVFGFAAFVALCILARRRWSKVGTLCEKLRICLDELAHDGATAQLCTPRGKWHVMHALQLFVLVFEDCVAVAAVFALLTSFQPPLVQVVSAVCAMIAVAKSLALWLSLACCCACRRFDRCRCCSDRNAVRARYGWCVFLSLFWLASMLSPFFVLFRIQPKVGALLIGFDIEVTSSLSAPVPLFSWVADKDGSSASGPITILLVRRDNPVFIFDLGLDATAPSLANFSGDTDVQRSEAIAEIYDQYSAMQLFKKNLLTLEVGPFGYVSYFFTTNCSRDQSDANSLHYGRSADSGNYYDFYFPSCAVDDPPCPFEFQMQLPSYSSQCASDGCGFDHPVCRVFDGDGRLQIHHNISVKMTFGEAIDDC